MAPETVSDLHYRQTAIIQTIKKEPVRAANINLIYAPKETPKPVEPRGRWRTAIVTAYSPHAKSCGKWSKLGKTSTGVYVRSDDPDDVYGIAADPKMVPYGTKIYVPGYFEKLQNNKTLIPTEMTGVDDTGGAMRKSARKGILHIDVRFRTQTEAERWGVREMEVFIYE